jgi:hypothetical protein
MVPPPPLHVTLGPSRIAAYAIVIAACALLSLILALPLSPLAAAALVGLVLGWLAAALVQVAWRRGAGVVVELSVAADLAVTLRRRDGALLRGNVASSTYVGAVLATLVWRPTDTRWSRSLVILPDMLAADDFRHLRVQLRYARNSSSQGRPASQASASTSTPLPSLDCSASSRR